MSTRTFQTADSTCFSKIEHMNVLGGILVCREKISIVYKNIVLILMQKIYSS